MFDRALFGRALFDHRTRRLVFTGLTAFVLSGCISYQRATHITNEDATDAQFLAQIVPGETDTQWLTTRLGQPTTVHHSEPGSDIWQYENVVSHRTSLSAIPLLAVELENATRTLYNFEVANERVMRVWLGDAD